MSKTMDFKLPTVLQNSEGKIRTVGFELEFGGADLDTTAQCIIDLYGGKRVIHNKFLQEVAETELGKFSLKMDALMLTEKSYEKTLEKFGIDIKDKSVEEMMESVASIVVPYEVGAPPIPMTQVHRIDELRKALHHKQAEGTHFSIFNAYATHINPELPALNAETILRYIKAFLLLYPAIHSRAELAIRRRLSSYINPFPEGYISLVLNENYAPDFDTLLVDYHIYNPDRNRPLDIYPAFAFIDKSKTDALPDIGNVKPRPTFHYRLPNCEIDSPEWSLAIDWNEWVAVENLANSVNEELNILCREYLDQKAETTFGFNNKWIKKTEYLLDKI
ncbi:MAG: amidoligase [Sphingobacteriales bacterium]|nr:MAG: amidoligase [Sphingobacteriales bacterium]